MRISYYTLITIILALVTLYFIITISGAFNQTATDDANTCAASVLVRTTLIDNAMPTEPLRGCKAEYKNITGSQTYATNQLINGYNRCQRSFQSAFEKPIIADEAAYCHVCGIYSARTPEEIEGFLSELQETQQQEIIIDESIQQQNLSLNEPVSIIFFQDRTEEYNLLTAFMPKEWTLATTAGFIGAGVGAAALTALSGGTIWIIAGTAAGAGVGGFAGYATGNLIPHPDGMIASGIIIREHNQKLITDIGCTTINPDDL
jgi:hypothetical protein